MLIFHARFTQFFGVTDVTLILIYALSFTPPEEGDLCFIVLMPQRMPILT